MESKKVLPPGEQLSRISGDANAIKQMRKAYPNYTPTSNTGFDGLAWGAFILPYIEETTTYNLIDSWYEYADPPSGPGTWAAGACRLRTSFAPVIQIIKTKWTACCGPTSRNGKGRTRSANFEHSRGSGQSLFASFISSLINVLRKLCFRAPTGYLSGYQAHYQASGVGNGLLWLIWSKVKARHISDGLSKTAIIGEVTGDLGWLSGTDSRLVDTGFSWITRDVQDMLKGVNPAGSNFGGRNRALIRWMVTAEIERSSEELGFSSFHFGGCHFAFADGHAAYWRRYQPSVLEALAPRRR